MAQKIYASVRLVEKRALSAQFDRLTFEGDELAQFPSNCEGGYIKLLFDASQQPYESKPSVDAEKPIVRSFTIVDFGEGRLAIDVVRGKNFGVAAQWAAAAAVGDSIVIVGPGKSQPLPEGYDNYVIVGDETAIPAILTQFQLHAARESDISGFCVVQAHEYGFDESAIPKALALHRVDRERQGHLALVERVSSLNWPEGTVYVWAACEFEQMRALRRYFRIERGVEKADMYISSYWKLGETDEGNKLAKKMDNESEI